MNLALLMGSLAGIVLLVILNRCLKLGSDSVGLSVSAARSRIEADYPDFEAGECLVSDTGMVALIESASASEFAVLVRHGSDLVSRRYKRADLRVANRDRGQRGHVLVLKTGDFSLPRLRIGIADDDVRAQWQARLSDRGGQHDQDGRYEPA